MNPTTKFNFAKLVTSLVQNLPELEKKVLSLYYVEKMTLKEISAILEAPLSEVQKAYHRGIMSTVGKKQA